MRASVFIVALGTLAYAAPLRAQELVVDSLVAVRPFGSPDRYSWPIIRMPGKYTIARRINQDLFLWDERYVDADTAGAHYFDGVWGGPTEGSPIRMWPPEWDWSRPMENVLVIAVTAEWCGAYCEESTTHHPYDLRSGMRLRFDSLFTPAGLEVVEDTIRGRWRRLIEAQIERMKDSVLVEGRPQDELDYFLDAFALYENCLKERVLERPYVADIDPQRGSLRVRLARCSSHVNRNADELDPMWIELPFPWLMPYLRKEIQALFMP